MTEDGLVAMFTVIILSIVSLMDAAVYKDGPCPNVNPVKNFNLTADHDFKELQKWAFQSSNVNIQLKLVQSKCKKKYVGYWYEVAKYPNDFENRGDCTFLAFKIEDGVIKFQLGEVADKRFDSYDGYIDYAPNSGATGIINYYSTDFKDKENVTIMPVYILDVDYNKYFITYECHYDETKKQRHEYAWVGSKTKTFDSQTKKTVDNFLKSSTLLDADKFLWDRFDAKTCKVEA